MPFHAGRRKEEWFLVLWDLRTLFSLMASVNCSLPGTIFWGWTVHMCRLILTNSTELSMWISENLSVSSFLFLIQSVSVFVAQSCLTLWPHELQPARLLCPWNSAVKNIGMGCHSLLQGIFPTQGLNLDLLHCRQVLNHLSHQGFLILCPTNSVSTSLNSDLCFTQFVRRVSSSRIPLSVSVQNLPPARNLGQF